MAGLVVESDTAAVSWMLRATGVLTSRGSLSKNQRAIVKELITEKNETIMGLARRGAGTSHDAGLGELYVELNKVVSDYVVGLLGRLGLRLSERESALFTAIVRGLNLAHATLEKRRCCVIGSGHGYLVFAAAFLADFSHVTGFEQDQTLYEQSTQAHMAFETELRGLLDSAAPRPMEIQLHLQNPTGDQAGEIARASEVIIVDGNHVSGYFASCAESFCRPGALVISLGMSLPESHFETLQSYTVSGDTRVTVQRRLAAGTEPQWSLPPSQLRDAHGGVGYDLAPSSATAPSSPVRRAQLAANESTAHISSPIGSSLLNAKRKRLRARDVTPWSQSMAGAASAPRKINVEDLGDTTVAPSSPMDQSLMMRKWTASRNRSEVASARSPLRTGSPLARPLSDSSSFSSAAVSSPMGYALRKRKAQNAQKSRSGGLSPTFRDLASDFQDD